MNNLSQITGRWQKPSELPPLREDPFAPDAYDGARKEWVEGLWMSQDDLLRQRDRQVEENLRMLHGQQWIVWSTLKGRYVNLAEHLTDDERRWRHMPVLNRLLVWFVLLHARMTENPPVITWNAGPDRVDAQLAEVLDPAFKYLWRDVGMLEVLDRLIAWMIPSGRAFLKSRIDPTKGDPISPVGRALLQLLNPQGSAILGADGQPITRETDNVPFQRNQTTGDFEPTMSLRYDDSLGDYVPKPNPGMRPETLYEGGLDVDVLTCLEVRGEWGQQIPWHRKQWHIHKTLLTPLQAWEAFGVELDPDVTGQEAESSGVLWRVLHGTGIFGSSTRYQGTQSDSAAAQSFCTIYERWERPGRFPGTERTDQSPGGRLTIVSGGGKVIRDGVRPHGFRYTSPLRAFDFVGLPGRPSGTSPQEFMNGPVRTRNRLHAQVLQHATLVSNPIRVLDRDQGLEQGSVPNIPGAEVVASRSRSDKPPVEFIGVPNIGTDVYLAADRLGKEVDEIGQIAGTEGSPPTEDPSGELIKELRFNADRPIAATMKRMVIELARMAEDWLAMLPSIWDREKVISVVGDDNIGRTIVVYPDLFKSGNVKAEPEIESMLPEGRGERQARMFQFWQAGAWGDPHSPAAINQFLELARFPHMGPATRPGSADRAMAEQNVGRLLQGLPANAINVYPWTDFTIHLAVLENFLKSPEYQKQDPQIQGQMVAHWQKLKLAQADAMMMEEMRKQETATGIAAAGIRSQQELGALAPPGPGGPVGQGPPAAGPSADLGQSTAA